MRSESKEITDMSEWTPSTPGDAPPGWTNDDLPLPPSSAPSPFVTSPQSQVPPTWEAVTGLDPLESVGVIPPHDPPGAGPTSDAQRPKRVGKFVAAAVAAAVLAGGGIAVGTQVGGDHSPAVEPEPVAVRVDQPATELSEPAVAEPVQAAPPLVDTPGPIEAGSGEPVADVARAVAPAVVRIDTGGGTGSGIIYDSTGLIITNAHVVGDFEDVSVQLADGRRVDGVVLGADPKVDIAVVQIDASIEFDVAIFAPTNTVEVGQLAVAIGSPFGLEQSVTAGIISAVNRAITNTNASDGSSTTVEMLQTDAPINPGNSGGALADRQGRVVGINTSIRTDGTTNGNLGVGFAVPSDTAILIANRIVAGESLDSGFLGVTGQDPITGDPGALITQVVADSPAEAGGLEVGDLVIGVNGEPVPGMTELAARIRLSSPGTVVELEVDRAGEVLQLLVTLGILGG